MPCRGWAMGPFGRIAPRMCPGSPFFPWPGHYPYRYEQQLRHYADELKSELARVEEAIRELEKRQAEPEALSRGDSWPWNSQKLTGE
ncbi:MAG: hypothetical protein ACE5JL_16420 [Dehalococcoidia bacterium]